MSPICKDPPPRGRKEGVDSAKFTGFLMIECCWFLNNAEPTKDGALK
jgi:hypothetical protein